MSFTELVVVALIAFIVLGPTEMIRLARKAGYWTAKMRTQWNNFEILADEQARAEEQVAKLKESLTAPAVTASDAHRDNKRTS